MACRQSCCVRCCQSSLQRCAEPAGVLGIDGHFVHTVGVEDVTHPKPHPEGLERILTHMGKRPEHTLVVGDSWSDVEAARNGGCWSCLATWALADPTPQLLKATPDFIAGHPFDVLRLVRGD